MSEATGPARDDVTTVAIVGAGPAGLVAAHLLHARGYRFRTARTARPVPDGDARQGGGDGVPNRRTAEAVGLSPSILRFDQTNYCCEFRTPEESVVFDYGTLTGDRPHYVYPQHELVARLCDALVDVDGDIRFGMEVTGLTRERRWGHGVGSRRSRREQVRSVAKLSPVATAAAV